jgi:hypothetical protein
LITDDILDRFPYKEHPDNVALVLAMAEELGCAPDFALKAMADEMVPDLGVLKTYPTADLHTRKLEFTNGMSANERFGCLGNWTRLGFDQHDPHSDQGVWVSTVVNNRADRVPRSRVFASILVNDIQADRHFLIGTNLKGLQGFLGEAWEEYSRGVSLWKDVETLDRPNAQAVLQRMAKRFRQPTEEQHVRSALDVMLRAVSQHSLEQNQRIDPDRLAALWREPEKLTQALTSLELDKSLVQAIHSHVRWLRRGWEEYRQMLHRIVEATDSQKQQLDIQFRTLLREWFWRKIVVIENSNATGEQIIHRICDETPPGFRNRVMGIQNIKGTGLDFAYRWQAWDACRTACEMLKDRDARIARQGLQALASMPAYGQLCAEHLRDTLQEARGSPVAQSEDLRAELDAIAEKLKRSLEQVQESLQTTVRRQGLLDWVFKTVEQFMDISDALRRRKKADQIYRDLEKERISRQRAVMELRALNKRQKGGWLSEKLAGTR